MWSVFAILCALVAFPAISADADGDEITALPGLPSELGFRHYSGFFQASPTHFLHYWFVESQNNPVTDPLIFWFNGGPGCSSLDGLLNEMGPYLVNPDGKTMRMNPNAWNKFANVVYMEAPAGVGYSYSTDGNTTTNDDQTSAENYEAIKQFFKTYPSFRNHTLYIMGESYGGIYVPTLTARIIDGLKAFPLNLKGMALGNGYVNEKLSVDTGIRYAYGHGLVDEKIWNTLEKECCNGCADTCDFASVSGDHCVRLVQDISEFMWYGGLNPYDMFRNCDPNPEVNSNKMLALMRGISTIAQPPDNFDDIAYDEANAFLKVEQPKLYGDAPCLNDSDVITYMNREEVKKALHIPTDAAKWDICSNTVTRTYRRQYGDMTPFVKKIIDANVRVLLYYGDTDMACNFIMGQIFADRMGIPRQMGKQPWKFNNQIAGFKTLYGHARKTDLIFLTVKGAGHMAPQWRAEPMQYAIRQFIVNHPI